MAIDIDSPNYFPYNVVVILADRIQQLDTRLKMVKRPLVLRDPSLSVAVFPSMMEPQQNSYEMRGPQRGSPTLEQYRLLIQILIKDTDLERGLLSHSMVSEAIHTMLGNDPALRLSLGGLQATLAGVTKRLQRWMVRSVRYLQNDINEDHVYLTVIDLGIEVEKANV